jgi:hypothetical protein
VKAVASLPLKLTLDVPRDVPYTLPVTVTRVPIVPELGLILVIVGGATVALDTASGLLTPGIDSTVTRQSPAASVADASKTSDFLRILMYLSLGVLYPYMAHQDEKLRRAGDRHAGPYGFVQYLFVIISRKACTRVAICCVSPWL